MQCPRCESERIQRDYEDAVIVLRVIGLHKLVCNNCGLVFKRFDPFRTVQRTRDEEHETPQTPSDKVVISE
jgi:transcription initiation factor TFIIIB Brf1 subunit/transcription initiation factor TFIIB